MDNKKPIMVHRCSFYDTKLSSVTALDVDETNHMLAVGRSNGFIEIWSFTENAFFMSLNLSPPDTTTTDKTDLTVSSVYFLQQTKDQNHSIIAFRMDSKILKIDLKTLAVDKIQSFAGAINNAALSPNHKIAACACQDGTARIFKISPSLRLKNHIANSSGALNSVFLTQRKKKDYLVAGSSTGVLGVWRIKNKRNIIRITVGGDSDEPPSINTLCVIDDEIICGDSSGTVSIYDFTTGTPISVFKTHFGPILALSRIIGSSCPEVICSGEDSKIAHFFQGPHGQWGRGDSFRPLPRKIRALSAEVCGKRIYAGGEDCVVSVSIPSHGGKYSAWKEVKNSAKRAKLLRTKVLYFRRNLCVLAPWKSPRADIAVSVEKRLLLSSTERGLALWKLTSSPGDENPVFMAETAGAVACLDLSLDGRLLFYCDQKGSHLLELVYGGKGESVVDVTFAFSSEKLPLCRLAQFISNDRIVLAPTDSHKLLYLNIGKSCVIESQKVFEREFGLLSGESQSFEITRRVVKSYFGGLFCLCGAKDCVVYREENLETVWCFKTEREIVSCAFSKNNKYLFVVLSSNGIVCFDLEKGGSVAYFKKYSKRINAIFENLESHFYGVSPDVCDENRFCVYGGEDIVKIDISAPPPPPPSSSKASSDSEGKVDGDKTPVSRSESTLFSDTDDGAFDSSNFRRVSKFKPLFFMALDAHSRVVVERDRQAMEARMPKKDMHHKFASGH